MKIAVIGAGIYGTTIAIKLAQNHSVTLYEAQDEILKCASGINQFRIHKGYHYPRSVETTISSLLSEPSFRQEYSEAIIEETENFYAISREKSLTSSEEYLKFLAKFNLEYLKVNHPLLNSDKISLCIKASENLINLKRLKKICMTRMKSLSVNLKLSTKATPDMFNKFDHVVISAYAGINNLIEAKHKRNYQFELCEQPIVMLPKKFKKQSIVILDGPFMCLDPYSDTNMFAIYDVTHSIHRSNIGLHPSDIPKYKNLLNSGLIKNPKLTNFNKFIESAEPYIPNIKYAKHVGSLYTHRAVLPNKEKTDERITIVNSIKNNVHTVFSGKIVNCVVTANHVKEILENKSYSRKQVRLNLAV